jgi:hypothetical protein
MNYQGKNYSLLFLFWIMLTMLYSSCDYTSLIEIHNSSKQQISVLHSNSIKPSTPNNVDYYIADWVVIDPDSTNAVQIFGKNAWHRYINQGPDKKLFLFIFSVDTLKRYKGIYSMNQLSSMHKYLKVLNYSEQELIKQKWAVDFKD